MAIDKFNIFNTIMLGALLLTVMLLLRWNITVISDVDARVEALAINPERFGLYAKENYNRSRTNGIYYDTGYYCVWTGDGTEKPRTYTDIAWTEFHEMCHFLVDLNFDHFCDEKWEVNDWWQ